MGERYLVYRPIPVKELLKEMKDLASLMIDLAYHSVLYGNVELAKEVFKLEERVDNLELLLSIQASLATRSRFDAQKMVSVHKLATATNKISDAAADIAKVATSKIKLSPEVAERLFGASEEIVTHVRVDEASWLAKSRLKKILRALDAIVDVIAVRRGEKWFLEPAEDFKVDVGDVLIVRGAREAVGRLEAALGGREPLAVKPTPGGFTKIAEDLMRLKRTAELMVDLAYTALLTKSDDIAERVLELEEYMDRLYVEFEYSIVSEKGLDASEKIGLLHIGIASEYISDAASEIASVLLKGLEPHPIIEDVLWESLERISVIEMDHEDDGLTLGELGYGSMGIQVLAVRRGDDWFIDPPKDFRVREGDILIVKYYSESEPIVEGLEKKEDREELIEEIQEEEWVSG